MNKDLGFNNISYNEWAKQHITPVTKLTSPKIVLLEKLILPKNAVLHYTPVVDFELGINKSDPLINKYQGKILTYHVDELEVIKGQVKINKANLEKEKTLYHKNNLGITKSNDLNKALMNKDTLLIINYCLLNYKYSYRPNMMLVYFEWYNLMKTVFDLISNHNTINRAHFIRFQTPTVVTSKSRFQEFADDGEPSRELLTYFNSNESLNYLLLWQTLLNKVPTMISDIPSNKLTNINIIFSEANKLIIVNLSELLDFSVNKSDKGLQTLYTFYDRMISFRSSIETTTEEDVNKDYIEDTSLVNDENLGTVVSDIIETETNSSTIPSIITKMIEENANVGLLSGAEQRSLLKLAEKSYELPNPFDASKGKIKDMVVTPEDTTLKRVQLIEDAKTVLSPSMLYSNINEFDSQYVSKVHHKDIVQSIMMLQSSGIIVKNITVKPSITATNEVDEISINVQPVNGSPSTVKIKIPRLKENGTFLINGVTYRLDKQQGELPINKINEYTVGLTSYYGRCFVYRNQKSINNRQKWLAKNIAAKSIDKEDTSVTNIVFGLQKFTELKLPRDYTAIGSTIKYFETEKYKFYWHYDLIKENFTEKEIEFSKTHDSVLCGKEKKTNNIILMDSLNNLVLLNGDLIHLGKIGDVIEDLGEGPSEFSELSLYNKHCPIILVLSYLLGLENCLSKLNISYTIVYENVKPSLNEYVLKLKNANVIININNPLNSILVNGFNVLKKVSTLYTLESFNKQSGYTSILSNLGINAAYLREIILMNDIFIDHITKEILIKMKEPTTFIGLLIRASKLLITDWTPEFEGVRFKGNERISGFIYEELAKSIRSFRSKTRTMDNKLELNPMAIHLGILQDQSINILEESNPIQNLKEKEVVTLVGRGGRNIDSLTKPHRKFNLNDLGTISESTPDSSKAGVRVFMSPDPNLEDIRGIVISHDKKQLNPVNCVSTTSIVTPCSNQEDALRINFTGIQNSHVVPCNNYTLPPFRTSYEQVIGQRVDSTFASKVKDDCIITEKSDDHISVKYKNGSEESFRLGVKHGKVKGYIIPHSITSDFNVGDKLSKDTVISFNDKFFERNLFDKRLVNFKQTILCTVALMECSEVIEDGCIISSKFEHDLQAPFTNQKDIVITMDTIVHNLVNVGDVVHPDSILCILEDPVTATLDVDKDTLSALSKLSTQSPKSQYHGTITNIEVLYYGDTENASESVKDIIKQDSKRRTNLAKLLKQDISLTGEVLETLHISGRKIQKGEIAIRIFIDSTIGITTGDKLVVSNQLKTTVSTVLKPEDVLVTESGNPIDMVFGTRSVDNRIVESYKKIGLMNQSLEALSLAVADAYFNG